MTGRENLQMIGRLFGLDRRQARAAATAVLHRLRLTEAADRLVRTYSGGMRRRLDLDEADQLASDIVIIDHGRVIAEGTPDALKTRAGDDVTEVRARDADTLAAVTAVLAVLGPTPKVDRATRRVSDAVGDGNRRLAEAVRALDDNGIRGVIVTTALFSGMGAAAGVAEDVEQGFFDRLRSLPIPRTAVLAGRCLADTALVAGGLAVGIALGFAIGFRIHGGVTDALAAFALCVLFSFALEWAFLTIGLIAGTAQAAQGLSMVIVPFTFVSSAYVPIDTMPGWLQAVGNNQPITPMVNAVRGLTAGPRADEFLPQSTAHYVGVSLIWTAAIVAVFGVLAVVRFARR